MSFKKELLEHIHALRNFVENIFEDFFSDLGNLIKKNGGELLLSVAVEAVKAAEDHGGSGEEKFAFAYNFITDKLKSDGVEAVVTAVEGAILGAVAKIKAR